MIRAFGCVHRAKYKPTGFELAVKVIRIGAENYDDVAKEINLLKQLNHKNIVRYYGTFFSNS